MGGKMFQAGVVTLRIFYSRFQNSAGGVNARQGPRTVMSTIPWRRSLLSCKEIFRDARRLRGLVDLARVEIGFFLDCGVVVALGVPRSSCSLNSSEGPKISLSFISSRTFSPSHRAKKVNNVRKRKTVKYINGSILIEPSLFGRFWRFVFGAGNGATHGGVGLDVLHPIIVHNP